MVIVSSMLLMGLMLAGLQMLLSYQKRLTKLQAKEKELKRHMLRRVKLVTPPDAVRDLLFQEFILN